METIDDCVDDCVKAVVEKTLSLGGRLLIAADHGNCEQMRNRDGSPNTAHTTNLVHILNLEFLQDASAVQE